MPTPGKAPGWPMINIGQWRIDVNGAVPVWLAEMKVWRTEHLIRMGYDDSEYRRPEYAWTQKNIVHTQMMVEDRYFYDPVAGKYTVDKYLDDLERLHQHRHRRSQSDRAGQRSARRPGRLETSHRGLPSSRRESVPAHHGVGQRHQG